MVGQHVPLRVQSVPVVNVLLDRACLSYMYIHMYTYIHTYTHTYIHTATLLAEILVKPSAGINLVPIQSIAIFSISTASLTLRCVTRMCLERSLETGVVASKLALLLSPHSVGMYTFKLRSVHNCFNHINSLAAELITISSASVVSPAICPSCAAT